MRLERNIAREEQEKKRRRRTIITISVILIMVIGVAGEIIALMNMASVDRRYLRSVERGVLDGWNAGRGDLQLRNEGRISDTSFIDAELAAVEEFHNKPYQDKKLKKLAEQYYSALRKCKIAADAHDPDTDSEEFWKEFSVGYTERVLALWKMYNGDYKIGFRWNSQPDKKRELLFRGWLADTIPKLRFEKTGSSKGIAGYKTVLTNDSGYRIKYINIDVELYDKNGKMIDTAEVYREDIEDGKSVNLGFYHAGKKVRSYRIANVDSIAETEEELVE
jgi:hypothetical protein